MGRQRGERSEETNEMMTRRKRDGGIFRNREREGGRDRESDSTERERGAKTRMIITHRRDKLTVERKRNKGILKRER